MLTRERLAVAGLVLLGLAVRFWGLQFGLPVVYARPDELLIIGVVVGFFRGGPHPHFFEYPTLYLYVLAGAYCLLYARGLIAGWFQDSLGFAASFKVNFIPFFLAARAMAALLGGATVAVVHAIAAPLFGVRAGLLAALFMAVAFLHVRDAHYATTDVPMAFFVMCGMLAIVRVHRLRRACDARLAGVLAGCAMGVKYNAAILVIPMILVEALHAWTIRSDPRRILRETHLLRMALWCAVIFVAGNPYLFLDRGQALQDLRSLLASTSTGMTPPELLGRGWTYHLPYSLWYGVGWPILFASFGGVLWMTLKQTRAAVILLSFPLVYYAVAGAGYNVFVRYMIPVVPFLCIFAGYFVAVVAGGVAPLLRVRAAAVAVVLGIAVAAPSAIKVVQLDRLLATEDSRLVAGRWVAGNVPEGSTMFISGNRYGWLQLDYSRYRQFGFDYRNRTFTVDRRPTGDRPQWLVIQRAEIPYAQVPEPVEALIAREYQLAHMVRAYSPGAGNFYDIQDGFYLPFGSFDRVSRPGPNILIYRRE